MVIWEMVGLWHYSIPGLFLLAQFGLGILVALGNLVNNSVFLYISDEGRQSSHDDSSEEGNHILEYNLLWTSYTPMIVLVIYMISLPTFGLSNIIQSYSYIPDIIITNKLVTHCLKTCTSHFMTIQIN